VPLRRVPQALPKLTPPPTPAPPAAPAARAPRAATTGRTSRRSKRVAAPPATPSPAGPPAAKPPPKRPAVSRTRRRRPPIGRILLTILLLGVCVVTGVAVWGERALHRIPALTDYDGRPAAGSGTNWLLVGSDSREGLTEEQQSDLSTGGDLGSGRTDTILLVHVPALGSGTSATMVSIPRDSYVEIPGYGSDKVNAAFSEGGAALLVQTVEQATGLRVDHYAEIGFGGFAGVVDALGGVTMCPAEPITDPLAGIDLLAGCQTLDGRNALGYVRSRATARADLDRMANQRQFVSAMLHRAGSPAVWANPWRWYAVPRAAVAALAVNTDDHIWDLARLGWALRDASTVTVPIGEFTYNDSGDVVLWDVSVAGELFTALNSDQPVPQSVRDAQP